MEHFRGLIFDMDGVIVDTEPLHAEAKRGAFDKYEINVPEAVYAQFTGRTDQDIVEYAVREFAVRPVSVAEVLSYKNRVYRSVRERLIPIQGAIEFIRLVRSRFEKLAVTTSATKDNVNFALQRFGLQEYFDVVVTADEIGQTKPHPTPYLTTTERLGLDPSSSLVIEDSFNGILSAKAAGCVVVAITTSFSRDELREAKADYTVRNFDELATLLGAAEGGIGPNRCTK